MAYIIAGIDVHKRVLMVTVADASVAEADLEFTGRQFGTGNSELRNLGLWLSRLGVQEVVMESTAQYWKPVWQALEGDFQLYLAQAWSNRAPRGRKTDFKDAQRLVRRQIAGELTLSFVPDAKQREMRALCRRRVQLGRDRVRLQNQLEALLEDGRVKLSSVITDLLGASGKRILRALAEGKSNPDELAELGNARLKCTREQLRDALATPPSSALRQLINLSLEEIETVERHMETVAQLTAESMQTHAQAVRRLSQIPGVRVLAAQAILAEIGPQAAAFPSATQLASWMGACPGSEQSAGENRSGRCPKGNRYLRRVMCQAAQAAVKTNNSHFQALFRRLLPRLGYAKAIWAVVRHMIEVVWKILHTGVEYEERGAPSSLQAVQRRAQRVAKDLRRFGFTIQITPVPQS